ncbi:MAG: 3-(3-hydroxy-phenyl)propionate hydroxylase [Oceanospirillaceae bacterium]
MVKLPKGVEFVVDHLQLIAQRLDSSDGCFYLLRPDQIVTARARKFDLATVIHMQQHALGE